MRFFATKQKKAKGQEFALPRTADFTHKPSLEIGQRPVALRYWPAYSNPYQKLFYGHPTPAFTAQPGDVRTTLRDCAAVSEHQICFHLHWLNFLFDEARTRRDGFAVFDEFLADLRAIRAAGGKIVWTIHNLVEHESADPEFEVTFRTQLAELADVIIVHGPTAQALVTTQLPLAAAKLLCVPHGSYLGAYDDQIDQTTAQAKIAASDCATLFANIGRIRPYKGTNALISAVRELDQNDHSVGFLLAGSVAKPDRAELVATQKSNPWFRVDIGYIADLDLQYYLNAADFIVLPYTAILTSGSAILALSFARPVIAPRIGGLADVISDGENGFLYDADAEYGLSDALLRAVRTSPHSRADMSAAALASAAGLLWSEGRVALMRALA